MSLSYAILGYLSWKPLTGYDLKKIFQDSSFMHWSGNNNQIYRTLLQLSEEELIESELEHRESAPSRKIYTITLKGQEQLKDWVRSYKPEVPEMKKEILVQLAWAGNLEQDELDSMLCNYEEAIITHIILHKEKQQRGLYFPNRTAQETYLWDKISENMISSYENELEWVQTIRKDIRKEWNEI